MGYKLQSPISVHVYKTLPYPWMNCILLKHIFFLYTTTHRDTDNANLQLLKQINFYIIYIFIFYIPI